MKYLAIAVPLLFLAACGSDDTGTPVASATLAITATGVSPKTVTLTAGGKVKFTNNDSAPHKPASNPHPTHTDCPELNAPNPLMMGQSFTATLAAGRSSCGFHDHTNPMNDAFKGTITIGQ